MGKFCIHCGKELEEGQVCDCQVNVVKEQTNDLVMNLSDVLKGMFVKPIDTIKKYTDESNFNLSLILLGIFSVALSLFVLSFVKNLADATSSIGSLNFYTVGMSALQIPYLKIFFVVLVCSIIFIFIYTGVLYLVNSVIFKGVKSFKKVFTMYGINSIITTASLLVAAILMFVYPALGLVVFIFGSILNVLYIYRSIETLGVNDENKHGYIYLITTVLYSFVLFVISKILS